MSRDSRRWLRPYLKPVRRLFREVLATSLFVNLLALTVPVFVLQVYDRVVFSQGLSTLQALVIGMALALGFDFILRQGRSRILQRMALQIDVSVGRALVDKLSRLPMRTLESQPTPYWQALFRDVEVVRNTLSGASAMLLGDLPFIILFFVLVAIVATPVVWVLVVMLGVFLTIAGLSSVRVGREGRIEREAVQSRDALVAEMLAGRSTIKALALESSLRPRWTEAQAATISAGLARGRASDVYVNLAATLSLTTTIAMTAVGALAILDQRMTIGALVAANILAGRFIQPLVQLVANWRTFGAFRDAAQRLGDVFGDAEERVETSVDLPRPKGAIAAEGLRYAYDAGSENPILADLTFRLGPGGLHAIVGPNGCGKTTLLKLLQGLYRPQAGRVLLDGADLAQFSRAQLAQWVGYVPQETFLFAGSIRDNILLAWPQADDAAILRAAERAGLHALAADLPDGYATEVGEAGGRLSGGARQRIAIARALVADPPVFMLDEPSGNLDQAAEIELVRHLKELARDHTVVVATHSPVLLQAADSIMALRAGRMVAAGPAREMLAKLAGEKGPPATARPATGTG